MKSLTILSYFFFIFYTAAFSQIDSINRKVDAYINEKILDFQLPGVAVAVIKNNVVIKKSFFGFSNLDNEVPVTNKTIFAIASIDKQITATCILMLLERGKLLLTDNISKYLDSVPPSWNKIQIRHLLSHTSGLPDEVTEYFKGRILIYYSTGELLDYIKKQELQFQPGSGFIYSDAGFVLLQLIVEKVSKQTYGDFLQKNILQPLGMSETITLNPQQIIKHRATSYYRNKERKMFANNFRHVDAGPLYNDIGSNIDDFIKYDNAINSLKLLKKETYEMMWTPFVLNDGRKISNLVDEKNLIYADASYGYAWSVKNFGKHRIIYHGGFTGTSITKFPEEGLTVIFFSNLIDRAGFSPDVMARHIAGFYIPTSAAYFMNPKNDPNPKTTQFIKDQLLKIGNGKIDSLAFTKEFIQPFTNSVPVLRQRLERYGPLHSLLYLDSEAGPKKTTFYYKASYLHDILFYQVSLKNKKIDFITIER